MAQSVITINDEIVNKSLQESYKILRTNLFYVDKLKVIAVTSTIPNEGKTVTAFNLARGFAEAGKTVVLIDCDLRKSSLKYLLNVSGNRRGISEYLTGQSGNVVFETNIQNLYVIMSGKKPPNPSEILSSEKFGELIEKLKETFDYVIIDTPPVIAAADASIIGREADGTVMVVRSQVSKKKIIKRAVLNLERNGVRIVGLVLNGVKRTSSEYGYDYGYGYGYGKE
mgnify:FL=1